MSSTIFYHEIILRIPASHAATSEDLFVHLCQCGASNCYEWGKNGRDGRRSRSWQVNAFGTEKQVLTQGIRVAGDVAGGMLKIGNATQWSKPETYIRRIRGLLKKAQTTNALEPGHRGYRGYPVSFSAFVHEDIADSKTGKTPYDWRDPEQFSAFHARFNAANGFMGMGFKYFSVSGPEMR